MLEFSKYVSENSLYTNSSEKDNLMKDEEKVLDSLIINFLGFLSLFSLRNTGAFKQYDSTEGKLQVNSIDDKNHDVSLSIKLAHDLNLINIDVVNRMTRLLSLIKQKKITSGKELNESLLIDLISDIRFTKFKPSTPVLNIMLQFKNGTLKLQDCASELYTISKKKEYKDITGEFRSIVLKGQYTNLFKNTKGDNLNVTPISDNKKSVTGVQDDEFFNKLLKTKNIKEYSVVFNERNLNINDLDKDKLKAWDNIDTLSFLEYINSYLFTICKEKGIEVDDLYKKMSIVFDDYFITNSIDYNKLYTEINILTVKNFIKNYYINSGNPKIITAYDNIISNFFVDIENKDIQEVLYQQTSSSGLINIIKTLCTFCNLLTVRKSNDYSKIKDFIIKTKGLTKSIIFYYNHLDDTNDNLIIDAIKDTFNSNELIITSNSITISKQAYEVSSFDIKTIIDFLVKIHFNNITISDLLDNSDIVKQLLITLKTTYAFQYTLKIFNELEEHKPSEKEFKNIINEYYSNEQMYEVLEQITVNIKSFKELKYAELFIETALENSSYVNEYFTSITSMLQYPLSDKTKNNIVDCILNTKFTKNVSVHWNFYNYLKFIDKNKIHKVISRLLAISLDFKDVLLQSNYQQELLNLGVFFIPKSYELAEAIFLRNYFDDPYSNYGEVPLSIEYQQILCTNFPKLKLKIIEENENYFTFERNFLHSIYYLKESEITEKIYDNIKDYIPQDYNFNERKEILKEHNPIIYKMYIDFYSEQFKDNVLTTENVKYFVIQDINEQNKIISKSDNFTDFMKEYKSSSFNLNNFDFNVMLNLHRILITKGLSIESKIKILDVLLSRIESTKTQPEVFNSIKDTFCDIYFNNPDKIKELIDIVALSKVKVSDIAKSLVNAIQIGGVLTEIYNSNSLIKPYEELTLTKLLTILKYNDIKLKSPSVSKVEDYNSLQKVLEKLEKNKIELEPLKIKEVKHDKVSLLNEVLNLNDKYTSKGKHGDIAINILREFNVAIPMQQEMYDLFIESHKGTEEMIPVFHGTGSIAATMILRNGFTVLPSTASGVVGRMLGDGVYFTNILDKAAQYVNDEGYIPGKSNKLVKSKGYIFQMKAALGTKGVDYVDASGTSFISPEWCVFNEKEQLVIYTAYEVEIISQDRLKQIKQENGIKESLAHNFKEYLIENTEKEFKYNSTYCFMDMNIPISQTETVNYLNFDKSKYKGNIEITKGQYGATVTIRHNDSKIKDEFYKIKYSFEIMQEPKDIQKFFRLLNGK